jgi:leucyl-tRNA synthetase
LESGQKTDNELINIILENLPCDVFVGEEHLKNWLVKKFFAESKLLHPRFRTRKYVIMGMGFVNGQKMSASKGRGVLVKDLIRDLGPVVARLTLLLSGGNIAKACNYDDQLPQTAQDFINRFTDHLIQVLAVSQQQKQPALTAQQKQITTIATRLDHLIEEGNFRQAITELIVTIPNQHKNWQDQSLALLNLYQKYLKILLPGLFGRFPMQ